MKTQNVHPLKSYFHSSHPALASTVWTHVPGSVFMWYCRHLSSLLVEGQALWCSLASAPVSALQTSHREAVGDAAMRDCHVSQLVCTMTVVTPSQSRFCQGPLTRSSLSLRQGSTLHLTPIPPCAVMSTAPPVTCPALPLNAPLPHLLVAPRAVTQVGSVCGNQGGLMSFNETDAGPR